MKDVNAGVKKDSRACDGDHEELDSRLIYELVIKINEAPESTLEILPFLGELVNLLENTSHFGSAFLFQVVPHVAITIAKTLVIVGKEITSKTRNLTLQTMKVVVSYMKLAIKCLKEDVKPTNVEQFNGLLIAVFTVAQEIVKISTECKREEAHPCSEELAVLTPLVFEALWLTISKLNETQFSDDTEAGVLTIVSVSTCLLNICKLREKVVDKPAILLWKAYSKIVVAYSNVIQDGISQAFEYVINKIIHFLANITNLFSDIGKTEDLVNQERSLDQSLMYCNFFIKVLATWCQPTKIFKGHILHQLHRLILDLYRFHASTLAIPNLSARLNVGLEIHVAEPMTCLLAQLFTQIDFQTLVLKNGGYFETEKGYQYAWCQLYLYFLENVRDLPVELRNSSLLDNGSSLLDLVFTSFRRCFNELALPIRLTGIMCQGKPLRRVTFYEHTCVRLCAVMVALSEEYSPAVEMVLLKNILGNCYWSNLLASDIWTFLCRLESSELCYHHCCCLAELVKLSEPFSRDAPWCLYLTFQRSLSLLADLDKERFIQMYPVSENQIIWLHAPTDLATDAQKHWTDATRKTSLMPLVNFLNRLHAADYHVSHTAGFNELISSICVLDQFDTTNSRSGLSSCLDLCKISLNVAQNRNDYISLADRLNSCIIRQARCLIPCLTNEQLLQMLRLMLRLTCQFRSDLIALGVLKFLRCLGPRHLVTNSKVNMKESLIAIQQSHYLLVFTTSPVSNLLNSCLVSFSMVLQSRELFNAIAELLSIFLSNTKWIMLEQALETFQDICQATPHVELILVMKQVLIGSPRLVEMVQGFMDPQAIPWQCAVKEYSALETLAYQQDLLNAGSNQQETLGDEHCTENDQRVQSLIADVRAKVADLEDVSQTCKLSAMSKDDLDSISTVIRRIIDSNL